MTVLSFFRSASRRSVLIALAASLLLSLPAAAQGKRLRVGITLHPYYSYVSNIVGNLADVVPVIPAGFNPHAYEPRAEDIKRIGTLDVLVMNGVGPRRFRRPHGRRQRKTQAAHHRGQCQCLAACRDRHGRAWQWQGAVGQGGESAYLPLDHHRDRAGQHDCARTGPA